MTIKGDLQSAGIMVATAQAFKLARKGVIKGLEKLEQRKAAKAVKTDAGAAGLSYALSLGLTKLPKIGGGEFVNSMSKGLRIGALTILGNAALGKILGTAEKKADDESNEDTE